MIRSRIRWLRIPVLFVLVCTFTACNKSNDGQPIQDPGGPRTPIHDIMVKLAKGPQSLLPVIGQELNDDLPPWEKLQSQTKESVELAESAAKHDPPKGSKESWEKMTTAFTNSASALDRAIQAKDKVGALAAHKSISSSCMACHREHKSGPAGSGKSGFGPQGKQPVKGQ